MNLLQIQHIGCDSTIEKFLRDNRLQSIKKLIFGGLENEATSVSCYTDGLSYTSKLISKVVLVKDFTIDSDFLIKFLSNLNQSAIIEFELNKYLNCSHSLIINDYLFNFVLSILLLLIFYKLNLTSPLYCF